MSAGKSMLPADARQGSPFAEAPPSRFAQVDAWLAKCSEWLNPILVKETRQALKSRQFLLTFTLLLVFGWAWSLLYLSMRFYEMQEGVFYAPHGAAMLAGYFWILGFPMVVIVPFTAFRSLSAEREDGTYELVAITSLSPRQIIGGKLGSAVLQMLIYMSALAPGMAFTYMLRGVDLLFILLGCFYLFLISIFVSVLGLLLATVTSSRHWQMVLGVIYILAVFWLYVMLGAATYGFIESGQAMPFDEPHFWRAQGNILFAYGGYLALFYLAAMARITFVSDNRSTKLRIAMTALQTFAIGWALYWWLLFDDSDARHVFAVLAWWSCANWAVFGLMMVGESAEMSPRVHRGLPQSFLGRMLLTWLNPGPGTGYMLMCVVSLTLLATTVLTYVVSNALHMRQALQQEELLAAAFVAAYLMLYVGLIRLAMLVFNRFTQGGIYLSGLLGVLLVLTAVIAPVVVVGLIQYLTDAYRGDFTILHVSNPFWVLYAAASND
ncbi:MAG: hypothetical protein KDA41_10770, partial [Planctomycetales bacterium]|nr:hypothetical protein [Planctomycetales bacterium]